MHYYVTIRMQMLSQMFQQWEAAIFAFHLQQISLD